MDKKTRPNRFTEALGEDVDSAFKNLASEILKDGALSLKEKSLIALACAVAVKCDSCTKAHKKQALKTGATTEEIYEAAAVAGLVRMGSGFNTAYSLLDDYEPAKKIRYKPPVVNEEKPKSEFDGAEDESKEFKKLERKPDGYLSELLQKNPVNKDLDKNLNKKV